MLEIINRQLPEKQVASSEIEIVDVWKTIQGEGPFAGTPAVFVRLSGCNLQCPLCDTDYTSGRNKFSPIETVWLIERVESSNEHDLIVFTGGEPFRQTALVNTVEMLLNRGREVQIETNGTLFLPFPEEVSIVCSPKTARLNSGLVRNDMIHSYKYVVEDGWVDPVDGLPTRVLGETIRVARPPQNFPLDRIFIQPCDVEDGEEAKANIHQAVMVCMGFGYRLSLQTHKILGLP